MTQPPTGPGAPNQRRSEPILSLAAIIAAGLASATAAIIRPYFDFGSYEVVLGAAFTSTVITTTSAIYKCCFERGRRWRAFLLVGLLAGLVVCFLGIASVSAAELAVGKTPSIAPEGKEIVPLSEIIPQFTSPPPSPPPSNPSKPPPCVTNGIDDNLNGKVDEPGDCEPPKPPNQLPEAVSF